MDGHPGAPTRRCTRFPTEDSVVRPGRARPCRAGRGGVLRHDRGNDHVELVPEFDLVVLATPRAALRVQTVRFSGSRSTRARAVHGLRHTAAKAARLRIQEARSASEPLPANSRTTAPMRGQQLRCASAGWRVRRSYNSPRLPGFRAGTDRSRSRSSGRAWHGAKRSVLLRTFRKCRKTSTAQVYARWVLSVKRE